MDNNRIDIEVMKYFTINELTKSSTAVRYNIDNSAKGEVVKNLILLVDEVLDPLREKFGRPIIVNSGYRCEALNKKVGGSKTSQHMTGQAVDIQSIGDKYNTELFELAKTMDYDQLIAEFGSIVRPDWIHISYVSPEKNRHQILQAVKVNGKTVYKKIS